MLLSREFIDYKELFVGGSDSPRLYCAVDEVYHLLSSMVVLSMSLRVMYTPYLYVSTPYMDFSDVVFGAGAHEATRRHNFEEVICDFGRTLLKLPAVKSGFTSAMVYFEKISPSWREQNNTQITEAYRTILSNSLGSIKDDDINHRDLLRFYLGLSKIPDEKLFSLI